MEFGVTLNFSKLKHNPTFSDIVAKHKNKSSFSEKNGSLSISFEIAKNIFKEFDEYCKSNEIKNKHFYYSKNTHFNYDYINKELFDSDKKIHINKTITFSDFETHTSNFDDFNDFLSYIKENYTPKDKEFSFNISSESEEKYNDLTTLLVISLTYSVLETSKQFENRQKTNQRNKENETTYDELINKGVSYELAKNKEFQELFLNGKINL